MIEDTKETVAFIGLGIMGLPMAANLQKAGFALRVYNRTASKGVSLVEKGAVACATPGEAASGAGIIITMVSDTPDVVAVVAGPEGVLSGAKSGSVIIDMSTISPDTTRELAAQAEARGIDWMDAPVSGGQKGAIEGTLTIFCGGREDVVERCRPVLETMSKTLTRMGEAGAGQAAKLGNQIVAVGVMLGVAEGLLYADKAGLDLDAYIPALMGGAAQSHLLGVHGPKIASRNFDPGFMVRLQLKDLKLALEAGRSLGVPLLGTSLVSQLFRMVEAMENGGDMGNQALVRALEKLADYEIGNDRK